MNKNLYLLLCMVFAIGCPLSGQAQIITTIAGDGTTAYTGDGSAAVSATFSSPTCVATDASGNVYINDQGNNCVRMVNPSGIITTIAGKGPDSTGYTGDGGPATNAKLSSNWGIAVDAAGNVYITDQNNNCIRKINTSGIITTIAGTGAPGFAGDGAVATAAKLLHPIGIAVDGAGNIYFGDSGNWRIRMINTSGVISTIAGTGVGGYGGDGGPALMANIGNTFGMSVDEYGNLYFCDGSNNRVRKITASGNISTVAGTGVAGYNMDDIPAVTAELNLPTGVFVSNAGELYIADYYNNRIRKVNVSGVINTIAGTGTAGFAGDGNLAINAKLDNPLYVTMDATNTILYLTDYTNVRIREVSNQNVVYFTGGKIQYITVCENSVADPVNAQLTILDHEVGFTDTWSLLYNPANGSASVTYTATATGSDFAPAGLFYTPDGGYVGTDSFTVTVNDGLAADTTTIYVTVDPVVPFAGFITGASNVCVGSSITLSGSVAGGTWSESDGAASLADSVVTGIYPDTDVITYTVTNPCGSASISKTISIDSLPPTGTITGTSALCIASSVSLSDAVTGGIWNVTNANASVTPGVTSCVLTGDTAGYDTVLYTTTTSLCEATTSFAVTIDTFPDAGVITGLPGVCVGGEIILSDATTGGVWGVSNSNVTISGDTLIGISAGMDSIIYSITNACGTDSSIQIVIIEPLPTEPTITQNESELYAQPGYTTYEWLLNGAEIPKAIADSYYAATPGLYFVTVTNTFGCSISSQPLRVYGCDPGDIIIYPNPALSVINILWCKKVIVNVYAIDGKHIRTNLNTNQIDISVLPNGVYMLTLFDTNGIKIKAERITKNN